MAITSPAAVLDVSRLPTLASGKRSPQWWGMFWLVIIESVVFALFIATYFYLRFLSEHWPPAGEKLPEIVLPTINTFILIGSSLAIAWGDGRLTKHGDQRGMIVGVAVSALLGALFVILKVVEYHDTEYYWDSHAYGSIVWTIIFFHSSHVASVVMKAAVVLALGLRGHFTKYRHIGLQINGLYWHFVVGIWIPLYFTIYITPRIP
jgi:heme/copper-type cytochrome/quinol oxidase subunit 3